MKLSRFTALIRSLTGITLLALLTPTAFAQGASAANVLGQLSAAFSGVKVVQSVQLSGNATWHAGSLEDSGTITLTASADGSSQMQLELAATGQRTESQTGAGINATCQWTGHDGVVHEVDQGNCWKPTLWFLPAFSLQSSLLPNYLRVVDLGAGTVGSGANVYRHLQSQLVLSGLPSKLSANVTQQSTTDLGLDPTSFLPAVLAYTVRPDSGAQTPIAIEVHYSNYRAVDGVQIPFTIQRYVNGALQLEIQISAAQIN